MDQPACKEKRDDLELESRGVPRDGELGGLGHAVVDHEGLYRDGGLGCHKHDAPRVALQHARQKRTAQPHARHDLMIKPEESVDLLASPTRHVRLGVDVKR
jgi:hypothetical protein